MFDVAGMAFMLKRQRKPQLNDLPKDILLLIFNKCQPVSRGRARAVCHRWRELIDGEDEKGYKLKREEGHGRLMVCDRRRAILEKITAPPCCSYAISDIVAVRNALYYQDTFAPSTITPHAFQFNFDEWTSNWDINEVWLTNFGSFLERDQTPHVNSPLFASGGATGKGPNKPGSYGATPPIDTTSSRYPRPVQTHRSEGSTIPPVVSSTTNVSPYNLLPSSQKASMESLDGVAELTKEMCDELTDISAGRFERLADCIKKIQPLNVIFNDQSFYQKRPTLLLFWFLKMLPNVRKLTFDCIQGVQSVELHKLISTKGIDELTIKQPTEKACLIIDDTLLLSFLEVDRRERHRFRLRFEGKGSISTAALVKFVKRWQAKYEIVPFYTLLVDALAVNPAEFVSEVLDPQDLNNNNNTNETLDKKQQEALLRKRQITFCHRRSSRYSIKYKYTDGYLMFYYMDAKDPPKLPDPPKKPQKLVTFTSVSNKTLAEEEEEERIKEEQEFKNNNTVSTYGFTFKKFLGSFGSFSTVRTTA